MATLKAYLTPYSQHKATDLTKLDPQQLAEAVFVTNYPGSDWIEVGTVEASVTLTPRAELVASQVAALNAEIDKTNAAAGKRVTELKASIQSLLAVEVA